MRSARIAAAILALAMALTLWLTGQGRGLLHAVIYMLGVLPGIPIGIRLFGKRHPAAWIAGALLGYGLLQLAIWVTIESRLSSRLGVRGGLDSPRRADDRRSPAVRDQRPRSRCQRGQSRDTTALCLVLLLVPVLMTPPYANLGREDAEGNRYYRAYFTADFLWHSALGFELGKFSLPPRNPYLAPQVMNYYWTYFLLPSTAAELLPPNPTGFVDLQRTLKANAIMAGLLMIAAMFLVVRSAVPGAWPAAIATALAVLAASAEGTLRDLRLRARRPTVVVAC